MGNCIKEMNESRDEESEYSKGLLTKKAMSSSTSPLQPLDENIDDDEQGIVITNLKSMTLSSTEGTEPKRSEDRDGEFFDSIDDTVLEKKGLLDLIDSLQGEKEELESRLRIESSQSMEEEYAKEKQELLDQIELLKNQNNNDLQAQLELEKKLRLEEKRKLEEEIEALKQSQVTSVDSPDETADNMKQEYERRLAQAEEEKNNLLEEIKTLRLDIDKSKDLYELDELIGQLDLVEEEHKQIVEEKNKEIQNKDAIISALGSQLSETLKRAELAEEKLHEQIKLTEQSQQAAYVAQDRLRSAKSEFEALREAHNKYVTNAERAREKACEEAREEMIERAEIQFEEANRLYVNLKKEFDASQDTIAQLEEQVDQLQAQVEKAAQERERIVINANAEIAGIKATKAKLEADAAESAKRYEMEIDQRIMEAKECQGKAKENDEMLRSMQSSLANIVAEKEKLKLENAELKSLSEELLAIVESQEAGAEG